MAALQEVINNIRTGKDSDARAFAPYGWRILTNSGGGEPGEHYDLLIPLIDSDITAENLLGGDNLNPSVLTMPKGIAIPGLFKQDDITIGSGHFVLAFIAPKVG